MAQSTSNPVLDDTLPAKPLFQGARRHYGVDSCVETYSKKEKVTERLRSKLRGIAPFNGLKRIERAIRSAQEPLKRMAGTLTRWCEPIVHYIRSRSSNGITGGCNNKIQLIQRMAYGLRNAHNRQKRIMASYGKT